MKLFNHIKQCIRSYGETLYFVSVFVLFIAGYLFFFTSNYWMPVSSSATAYTEVGRELSWNGKGVTLTRWDYCEKDQLMEVEIDIRNLAYDGQNRYQFSAQSRSGKQITVTPIIEDEDWIILHLVDVPERWSEILLWMDQKEYSDQTAGALKLFTNINDVNEVDRIETKDWAGYRKQRFENQITLYQDQIAEYQKEIADNQNKIQEIEKEILRLDGSKKYQTVDEQVQTDQSIENARKEIAEKQQENMDTQDLINQLTEKVSLIQKQMEEVLPEDTLP